MASAARVWRALMLLVLDHAMVLLNSTMKTVFFPPVLLIQLGIWAPGPCWAVKFFYGATICLYNNDNDWAMTLSMFFWHTLLPNFWRTHPKIQAIDALTPTPNARGAPAPTKPSHTADAQGPPTGLLAAITAEPEVPPPVPARSIQGLLGSGGPLVFLSFSLSSCPVSLSHP